jgi:fatty acid elongase 3
LIGCFWGGTHTGADVRIVRPSRRFGWQTSWAILLARLVVLAGAFYILSSIASMAVQGLGTDAPAAAWGDSAWTQVAGQFLRERAGRPAGTSAEFLISALGVYLTSLWVTASLRRGLRKEERARRLSGSAEGAEDRYWFSWGWLVTLHNLVLCAASAVLLHAFCRELWHMRGQDRAWGVFCDASKRWTRGRIYDLYYANYLLKYVELVDTWLLVLRGKPLRFLHVYHHAATVALCWSQLHAQSSVQWVVITLNLAVHVPMYAYYALQSLGHEAWWKKYLTQAQILQFVLSLAACGASMASQVLHTAGLDGYDDCAGTWPGAVVGVAVLASYLALFIAFFRRSYKAA